MMCGYGKGGGSSQMVMAGHPHLSPVMRTLSESSANWLNRKAKIISTCTLLGVGGGISYSPLASSIVPQH